VGVNGTANGTASTTRNVTELFWPTRAPSSRAWRLRAEASRWPRKQNRWRKWAMDRTEEYSEALGRWTTDDRPDSIAWKANATDFRPFGGTGRSSLWWAICNRDLSSTLANGTNGTGAANSSNGTSSKRSLASWPMVKRTFCAPQDLLAGNYSNLTAAEAACGKNCSAVQDVGCKGREFRLCRIGAAERTSKAGTCLRMRSRRGPQEKKFWRDFCARKVVPFRLLFPGRKCAAGKVLAGALTEVACAEKAGADTACSKFFDVRMAAPPPASRTAECRCLPKGSSCEAAPDPTRDVFVLA